MKTYKATTVRILNPDGLYFNAWHLKTQNSSNGNTNYICGCQVNGAGVVKMQRPDEEPDFTQEEKDALEAAIEFLNTNTHPVMP